MAHEARVPLVEIVSWLRGTALATLAPFTGTAPSKYATNGVGARGLITQAFCAAFLDRLATGTRASYETNGGSPDIAVGRRVECTAPPSNCHLRVRNVPGWRAFGFPLGWWAAPRRIPGVAAETEEAGEGGTPPWWPDMCGLPGLPL